MSIKDEVLKQLEENKGEYISGGQLATNLNVSRNSIWKAIKTLEKDGYSINAIPNKGYCLEPDNDILSPQSIEQYLNYPLDLSVYKTITSTNTVLKEKAEQSAPHGTVLIATEQTLGRGRMGKKFYSPSNTGLYISILVRPDIPADQALFLTTSAAVATAKAIEGKKVCGILTEAAFNIETSKLDYAIVGIGINVCPPEGGFPEDISEIATAIFEKSSDAVNKRSILVGHLLNYFMEYYESFDKRAYLDEYISRSMIIGQPISVLSNGTSRNALALEIDKECHLKVRYEDGSEEWLNSGEVSTKIQK